MTETQDTSKPGNKRTLLWLAIGVFASIVLVGVGGFLDAMLWELATLDEFPPPPGQFPGCCLYVTLLMWLPWVAVAIMALVRWRTQREAARPEGTGRGMYTG